MTKNKILNKILIEDKINKLINFIKQNDLLYEIKSAVDLIDKNNKMDIEDLFDYILEESFENNKSMCKNLMEMFDNKEDIDINKIEDLNMYKKLNFIKKIYNLKININQPHNLSPFKIKETNIRYNSLTDEIILTIIRGDDETFNLELDMVSLIQFNCNLSKPILDNINNGNNSDFKLDHSLLKSYLKTSEDIMNGISKYFKNTVSKKQYTKKLKNQNEDIK